jgi:hypothetical protein
MSRHRDAVRPHGRAIEAAAPGHDVESAYGALKRVGASKHWALPKTRLAALTQAVAFMGNAKKVPCARRDDRLLCVAL